MLSMWKDIAGGDQVDEMVVKMMVVLMDWMLETDRGLVVGQVSVKVWGTKQNAYNGYIHL